MSESIRKTIGFMDKNPKHFFSSVFQKSAIAIREILRNFYEHKATKSLILPFLYEDKNGMLIAGDSTPFQSLYLLKKVMELNTSGEKDGMQGNGMKRAAFLLEKDNPYLIAGSRKEEDIGMFVKFSSTSDPYKIEMNIEEDKNFENYLKSIFGKQYKKYNTFVFYSISGIQGNNGKISQIISLVPEYCDVLDEMEVSYLRTDKFLFGQKVKGRLLTLENFNEKEKDNE